MNKPITKAIIPAAGLGTRFLPQTKAMPKEMIPIVDKPVIQMIVEELVEVGVTDIIVVTGPHKRSIEDHFDRSVELEGLLEEKGKTAEAKQIKDIAEMANFIYVRQKGEPKGNARPVINASHLLGDEAFFVLFPDDLFKTAGPSRARQLLDVYEKTGSSVISLMQVDETGADKYGIVRIEEQVGDDAVRIAELIEKPGADKAPSDLASVGGYLLTTDMLPVIRSLSPGKGGEIVLADAINEHAQVSTVYGKKINGTYHDTGDKLRYIEAVVDMALAHPELGDDFREFIKNKQF